MTSVTAPGPVSRTASRPLWGWAVTDAITIAWRNLKGMSRVPAVIIFSTVQPIIFVLTFRYVFGGAIQVRGDYVDFLMPGVFVQTMAFGSMATGVALSEDLHKGLIERFRSLPMARSAVLAGRVLADLVRNAFVLVLMVVVGFIVGFDYQVGALAFVGALGLLLLFGVALSWIFAIIGLSVPNVEAAQAASFPILALMVFASSAFAPIEGMPGWLQAYNDVQPVSVAVKAARALSLGGPTLVPVLHTLAWIVGLMAVFCPLAVARYRRSA